MIESWPILKFILTHLLLNVFASHVAYQVLSPGKFRITVGALVDKLCLMDFAVMTGPTGPLNEPLVTFVALKVFSQEGLVMFHGGSVE